MFATVFFACVPKNTVKRDSFAMLLWLVLLLARGELRLFEWMELRLLEWRDFRVIVLGKDGA